MANEKKYQATYNPDKKRGEVLKDRVSTREYFYDEEGEPSSGLKGAEKRAAELNKALPSSRTKMIEKEMADGLLKKGLVGISKFADRMGFRQEDEYADKTKEEMSQKKAKGGAIMKDKEMKDMKKMGRGMAKADMQKKGMKGYAAGGMPMVERDGKKVPSFAADGKGKMAKGGIASSLKAHAAAPASKAHAKMAKGGMACGTKKMAKGGSIDGCATKGKTKGRMV